VPNPYPETRWNSPAEEKTWFALYLCEPDIYNKAG
jgi:hypothetical protein